VKVKPTLEEVLELGGLYCALTSREAGNAQDFYHDFNDFYHDFYIFLSFANFFSSLLVIQHGHVWHWIGGHSF